MPPDKAPEWTSASARSPLTPSQVELLYAYNRWANRRLVAAASTLPVELLTRELAVSFRSVWGTVQHILWGEWLWLGRCQERPSTGPSPLECRDLGTLRFHWVEIEREQLEFLRRLTAADLERPISYENPPGTNWTYPLAHMLQHVVNHSTYHRGQIAAMLRQLGTAPPPTDYLVFFDELAGGSAATTAASPVLEAGGPAL
ncbi:MAG: DinB family protein [Acidimicrobiia bacterium]